MDAELGSPGESIPLSVLIGHLLPRVHRYARLSMGSRQGADDLVRTLLETVIREPTRIDWEAPRLSLLRTVVALTRGRDAGSAFDGTWPPSWSGEQGRRNSDPPLAARLAGLPWRERHALLLVVVEELSEDRAAEVLDMGALELRRCLIAARRRLN